MAEALDENDSSESFSRRVIRRIATLDAILLSAILVSVNLWIAPTDPGWLNLNPTPYLLLPILIGGRFGFLSGIGAGAFSVAIIVAGQSWLRKIDPVASLSAERYFYTCLILMGGVSGELQLFFAGKLQRLTEIHSSAQERLLKLDSELYFLREAKGEADQIIATHDTGLSTLETDVRELHLVSNEKFYQHVLGLLNRQAHVADAAIYGIQPNQQLLREAVIGKESALPSELPLAETEMALLAIERNTVVSISEFWKLGATRPEPYLVSLPFLDEDDKPVAVLLITGMPFFALNQKSVHLITVICRWAGKVMQGRKTAAGNFRLVDGVPRQKIFTEKILRRNLDLASLSYQSHQLPSTLVFFSLPGLPMSLQPALERGIISSVRAGDFAAQLDLGFPNLAVLFPLTGEQIVQSGVTTVLARLEQDAELARSVTHRVYTLDESKNGEQLWQQLLDEANEKHDSAD